MFQEKVEVQQVQGDVEVVSPRPLTATAANRQNQLAGTEHHTHLGERAEAARLAEPTVQNRIVCASWIAAVI